MAEVAGSPRERREEEASTCSVAPSRENHGAHVESAWPCARCTYHNSKAKAKCQLCGAARESSDSEETEASEGRATGETEETSDPEGQVTLFAIIPCRRLLNGALRGVFALMGSFAGAMAGAVAGKTFFCERAGPSRA